MVQYYGKRVIGERKLFFDCYYTHPTARYGARKRLEGDSAWRKNNQNQEENTNGSSIYEAASRSGRTFRSPDKKMEP